MALIEDFVTRYRKEYDFYEQAGHLAAQLLDLAVQSAGIRCMVTSRAKSPARLETKTRQRFATKKYSTLEEIYADIVDLAGVRVALYFPAERDQVGKLIRDLFVLVGEPKEFPASSKPSYAKRFSGYCATHYRVRLQSSSLNEAQRRYADANIEIQVASVIMHAWAEVEHDLVYKPLEGRLSDEEYAILDELNGLVITGEIALERLQKAGEARIAARGRPFQNQYELAAYLLDKAAPILKGPTPEVALGRLDLLYYLLKKLGLATPEHIEAYVQELSSDVERRPLAEQIVDQLLAEDESRYKMYEDIRTVRDRDTRVAVDQQGVTPPDVQQAIGFFLSQWIEFEKVIRKIVPPEHTWPTWFVPTGKALRSLPISATTLREIDHIRRLRNNLVHGIDIPNSADIVDAGQRLKNILQELKSTSFKENISKSNEPDAS